MTAPDPIASQQGLAAAPAAAVSESTGSAAVDEALKRFKGRAMELTPDEELVLKASGIRGAVGAILGFFDMNTYSRLIKGRNELFERNNKALEALEADDSVAYESSAANKAA